MTLWFPSGFSHLPLHDQEVLLYKDRHSSFHSQKLISLYDRMSNTLPTLNVLVSLQQNPRGV